MDFNLLTASAPPIVSCLRSRGRKGGFNRGTIGFVDRRCFESFVQQDKQHHVPFVLKLDAADALAWLRVRKKAAAFDLKVLCPSRCFPDGVVASLTNRRQFNVQGTSRLVFSDLTSNPSGRPVSARYSLATRFTSARSSRSLSSDIAVCLR
jgi:hypothetical protein